MKFQLSRASGRRPDDPETVEFNTMDELKAWCLDSPDRGGIVISFPALGRGKPSGEPSLTIYDDYIE